ncbi:MAG: HPF/RaiA family ribosome-associated protein [candidate division Zixibacteria bacterium]|nr:HPF/RaiA family ribosome-associated protein [candidate division Zixibacteria bacterium]
MRIHVVGRTVEIDDGLFGFVEHRILLALGRLSLGIHCAIVRLHDLNGPRGGMDKTCRIEVRLRSRNSLVVEHTDSNLYAAISRAADRAGRAVVQAKGRARRHRRDRVQTDTREHLERSQENIEDLLYGRNVEPSAKEYYR